MKMRNVLTIMFIAGVMFMTNTANADVIMEINQVGGDVVMSYSGSLNLSGLAKTDLPSLAFGTIQTDNAYYGSAGSLIDGYYNSITSVITGSPAADTSGGVASGDPFLIWLNLDRFWVKDNYSSDDPINGSVTWSGTTLGAMGLTPGVTGFTATLNNGTGDTISLSTIPEPSTLAFIGVFGGGLWFIRRYFPSV